MTFGVLGTLGTVPLLTALGGSTAGTPGAEPRALLLLTLALLVVSGLAVVAGRTLLRYVALHWLHYVGATICLVLAGLTAWELAH